MNKFSKINHLITFGISTVVGVGYIPGAPGTWGSMLPIIFAYFFYNYFWFNTFTMYFTIFITFVSLPCIAYVLDYLREKSTSDKERTDPSYIVIDEVVGQFITILIVSYFAILNIYAITLCFIAFRAFDILKPWPIFKIESFMAKTSHLKVLGVVVDDVLAGTFAGIIVSIMMYIF